MAATKPSAAVAHGLCHCNCGQRTQIATRSRSDRGWIKGQPKRYIVGHNRSHTPVSASHYVEEDRGYDTPCWMWQRKVADNGYGHITVGGRDQLAHRYYFEQANGPIPSGLTLDHLCVSRTRGLGGSRACVNPDHLEPVTQTENTRRGLSTKLNSDDVAEIRRLYAAGGVSQYELARRYGISQPQVSLIVAGKAWPEPACARVA